MVVTNYYQENLKICIYDVFNRNLFLFSKKFIVALGVSFNGFKCYP